MDGFPFNRRRARARFERARKRDVRLVELGVPQLLPLERQRPVVTGIPQRRDRSPNGISPSPRCTSSAPERPSRARARERPSAPTSARGDSPARTLWATSHSTPTPPAIARSSATSAPEDHASCVSTRHATPSGIDAHAAARARPVGSSRSARAEPSAIAPPNTRIAGAPICCARSPIAFAIAIAFARLVRRR